MPSIERGETSGRTGRKLNEQVEFQKNMRRVVAVVKSRAIREQAYLPQNYIYVYSYFNGLYKSKLLKELKKAD